MFRSAIPIDAIRQAAARQDMVAAVENLYARLDDEIAAQSPTCWNKGECCRFGEYGHRLFVTTLEVAYYVARETAANQREAGESGRGLVVLQQAHRGGSLDEMGSRDACPHAFEGRCHARAGRPMGCRVFYCDPGAQHWQGAMTEDYLARLRGLHEAFDVPYVYADWMEWLRALGVA